MHRGELGAGNLNQLLQEALTDAAPPSVERGARSLRVGDKVMQVRNDYDKEVWNGDSGVIEQIDAEAETLSIRFDDRAVEYGLDELDELALAYAATVHKSQGSEYPAVVIPRPHAALRDAAAQPALHRGHARQAPGRAGRLAQGARHSRSATPTSRARCSGAGGAPGAQRLPQEREPLKAAPEISRRCV